MQALIRFLGIATQILFAAFFCVLAFGLYLVHSNPAKYADPSPNLHSNSESDSSVSKLSSEDQAKVDAQGERINLSVMNIRTCIRQNLNAPYQQGAYGIDQVTTVYKRVCYPYYADYWTVNSSYGFSEITESSFKLIVLQSIDPVGYQKMVKDFNDSHK